MGALACAFIVFACATVTEEQPDAMEEEIESCAAPMMECGTDCVDLSSDVNNCGACGTVCGTDQTCNGGVCTCATVGQVSCEGACIDPATEDAFCGAGVDCAANPGVDCGADAGCDASTCRPRLVNGSFETGDYTGWTLADSSGIPAVSIWGVLPDATALPNDLVITDLQDAMDISPSCLNLAHPPATAVSEGAMSALHMQGGPARHSMTQDIYIFPGETTLSFDMLYLNTQPKDDATHFIALNVRDPMDDTLLATIYKTAVADPDDVPTMTTFGGDVTPFQGQLIRIEYELMIQAGCWTINFDNFRVE